MKRKRRGGDNEGTEERKREEGKRVMGWCAEAHRIGE